MAQISKKHIHQWTEQHEAICLQKGIIGSAQKLWYWLIHSNPSDKTIEPDLLDFNKWIEKERGRGYCHKQLKNAFNKLIECAVINPLKKFSWHCYKLKLALISVSKNQQEKESENSNNSSKIDTSKLDKPKKVIDRVLQQQKYLDYVKTQVSEETKEIIRGITKNVGIELLGDKCEIFHYPPLEVKAATAIYKGRYLDSPKLKRGFVTLYELIPNPVGWLIDCLREQYWLEDANFAILMKVEGFNNAEFFYSDLW